VVQSCGQLKSAVGVCGDEIGTLIGLVHLVEAAGREDRYCV